jgi:hypothetical protein
MKFQVEIVHEVRIGVDSNDSVSKQSNTFQFTTSANLQPQQISTNVTVKATANGSLKYEPQDLKSMKMEPPPDILQDFKQEPDNEFADLVIFFKSFLSKTLECFVLGLWRSRQFHGK